ncbi:MAG: hypothetical protein JW963_12645, partial [Anaerolineales bacterium]|nr:hypothetical protein [Anaerolineales bacterium]
PRRCPAILNLDNVIARRRFSVEAIPHFREEIASRTVLAVGVRKERSQWHIGFDGGRSGRAPIFRS